MRWMTLFCSLAMVAALGCAKPAPKAAPTPRQAHDPRAAHAEADHNGDGQLDRQEFHVRMVEVFFHGDRDKDGYLTWEELEATTVFPDDFREADMNDDGKIAMYEFIRVRFYDYDEVDTDEDGLLSVDEIVVVFERGGVR